MTTKTTKKPRAASAAAKEFQTIRGQLDAQERLLLTTIDRLAQVELQLGTLRVRMGAVDGKEH